MEAKNKRIAVVGCGKWGKNLVRNFYELGALDSVYDIDSKKMDELRYKYGVQAWVKYKYLLEDRYTDAVVIATPAESHYELARKALEAGKDVFVEKPLALRYSLGKDLVQLAEKKKRILMVGHLMNYHPAIVKLKDMVKKNRLGEIYCLAITRTNLRFERQGENVMHDLASHDISVMLDLLKQRPTKISIAVKAFGILNTPEAACMNVHFDGGCLATIYVSWRHPFGERKFWVIGSKRMATFDDLASEKLKLFSYRDTERVERVIPYDDTEPLRVECQHFLDCIRMRIKPRTDGMEGLRVLKVISGKV